MISGLAIRISLVLTVILAVGVAVTTLLSVYKFENALATLQNSRMTFIVSDARNQIQTRMDLGLSLADLEGMDALLQRYVAKDPRILSIEVFNTQGTVLFTTDSSQIGDLVTEDWVLSWEASVNEGIWQWLDRDASVVGVPLRNNLGQDVGSLALRSSREFLDASVASETRRMLIIGLLVVVAVAPLCTVGATYLLRGPIRDLRDMADSLDQLVENHLEVTPPPARSSGELVSFVTTAIAAHEAIDSATEEIRRLDEEEAV